MLHPYATELYAASLSHLGRALTVPEWGCSVVIRDIPGGGADACGTYPLAVLAAEADLAGGLKRLAGLGLVSVTLVLDEFHRPPLPALEHHFQVVRQFKTHHIRRRLVPFSYDKHHRYRIRRAYRTISAGRLDLIQHEADWTRLYATLKQRHQLTGLHDFPSAHLHALQTLPGVTAFGAWLDGELVSAQIWVGNGVYVHGHLAASSEAGYREGAAYAAYDASMAYFDRAEVVNLGGGAGLQDDASDGLTMFKRGFANDAVPAYLVGAVLDPARYHDLVGHCTHQPSGFFPLYRARVSESPVNAEIHQTRVSDDARGRGVNEMERFSE